LEKVKGDEADQSNASENRTAAAGKLKKKKKIGQGTPRGSGKENLD